MSFFAFRGPSYYWLSDGFHRIAAAQEAGLTPHSYPESAPVKGCILKIDELHLNHALPLFECDIYAVEEAGLTGNWDNTRRIAKADIERKRGLARNRKLHMREVCADVTGTNSGVLLVFPFLSERPSSVATSSGKMQSCVAQAHARDERRAGCGRISCLQRARVPECGRNTRGAQRLENLVPLRPQLSQRPRAFDS